MPLKGLAVPVCGIYSLAIRKNNKVEFKGNPEGGID